MINNIFDILEDKFLNILCRKVKDVKFRKQVLSFKILHIIWYIGFSIPRYLSWFLTKRLICIIKGCKIETSLGGYVEECPRCEAWEEFGDSSEFKLIRRK